MDYTDLIHVTNRILKTPTPTECNIPGNGLIATYLSHHSIKMSKLALQLLSETEGIDASCIQPKFITICVSKKTYDACVAKGFPNCALVETNSDNESAFYSGFRGALFQYLKWCFVKEMLKTKANVFFIDNDVLILCNPWKRDLFPRSVEDTKYDMIVQRETIERSDSFNAGQIMFMNTEQTNKMLDIVNTVIDQALVRSTAIKLGMQVNTFNPDIFASHCWEARFNRTFMCTMHANCQHGINHKMFVLHQAALLKKECGVNSTICKGRYYVDPAKWKINK